MNIVTAAKRAVLVAALAAAGCVSLPTGPSVLVLPGTGKSFDQFRNDDADCRQYAFTSIGGTTAADNANRSGVASAAIGTAVGAAAGAAIGGSQGAAVGAGVGLGAGSIAGVGAADSSLYGSQRRYDFAYQQCMYAKGHRVPVSGRFATEVPRTPAPPVVSNTTPPPPPPGAPPPPPPGAPPPPPPGVVPPAPPGAPAGPGASSPSK